MVQAGKTYIGIEQVSVCRSSWVDAFIIPPLQGKKRKKLALVVHVALAPTIHFVVALYLYACKHTLFGPFFASLALQGIVGGLREKKAMLGSVMVY